MISNSNDVHDRTHRLAKLLAIGPETVRRLVTRRVVLELGSDAAATENGKLAFLTLCNLATRLGPYVPNLYMAVPAGVAALASPVYPTRGSLEAQALWILRSAVPLEGLVRGVADRQSKYDVAVTIGAFRITADARLNLGWDDWLGVVGKPEDVPLPHSDTNPFGALTASAMAVARLHGMQLLSVGAKVPVSTDTWRLNALTLSTDKAGAPLVEIGTRMPRSLLVGAGALGSSFCYAMTHVRGLQAEVDVVDPDVLKPPNANRQITAPFDRAKNENVYKVDDLACSWTAVRPFALTYDEFKSRHGRSGGDYEIAITAVDNAEVRREVAKDLPNVLIDGATGGLMVALMRGADPKASCVACTYAEVFADEESIWARRLGASRAQVRQLRDGSLAFTDEVLRTIREEGTLSIDEATKDALRREGWSYLVRARCGGAKPDRDMPSASVSYVSSLCGFLMAAQVIGETIGSRTLVDRPRWVWGDLLRDPPHTAELLEVDASEACIGGHERRSRIYKARWRSLPPVASERGGSSAETP